jgi:hypothetical protein
VEEPNKLVEVQGVPRYGRLSLRLLEDCRIHPELVLTQQGEDLDSNDLAVFTGMQLVPYFDVAPMEGSPEFQKSISHLTGIQRNCRNDEIAARADLTGKV